MSAKKPIIPKDKLPEFCHRHHIAKLALYGSMLNDEFSSHSDVDILVFFNKSYEPSLFDLVDMENELSAMIGRQVDLRTPGDLSPYFKDDVLKHMEILYA
jgi:uncharacterized protein